MRTAHTRRRAVTLLELLVTVAATIVLTAVLIVTIRGVRGQTLVVKDLNNLRLSAQDMLVWSAENNSKFLNIESTESSLYQSAFSFGQNPVSDRFWGYYYSQPHDWNRMLGMGTAQRHLHWHSAYGLPIQPPELQWSADRDATLWRRGDPQVSIQLSRFRYTLTLVTRPELWENSANAISTSASQLEPYSRAVRIDDTRFPSGKGMLSNYFLTPDDTSHVHVAFVDGSSERRSRASMVEPAIDPASFQGVPGYPVQHTRHGHWGRDR